jgi:chorismate dehydratase
VVRPLRLGVVSYLNAVPTVHGLGPDPRFLVEKDVPARVAARLHAGEIDLGLIPSIEFAFGDYAIVPGVAVASRGPVRSVLLLHRGPFEGIRRVALDASSRTSAALCKVLLRDRLGRHPEYVVRPPDVRSMLNDADAALVIGDVALDWEGPEERLDLGAEWTRTTGHPFVYAFWAGPRGPVTAAHVEALQGALRQGRAAAPEIASSYNGHGSARRAVYEAYLRDNIVYALGEAEQEGLREFYRRAHALELIPWVPELRFHGHP